jgi:type IV secretory pathway VirB10-like protein
MLSNRLAFAALAIACVGAAAGGGYLASRQTAVPVPASAQAQPSAAVTPVPASASSAASGAISAAPAAPARAVQETEAVVSNSAPASSAAKPGVAKRVEPPARSARENRPAATDARLEPASAPASSWPSSAAAQPPYPFAPPSADAPPAAPRQEERAAQEPARAPEPAQHTFEELVVSKDSVIGLQTEGRLSSETARVEDRVEARVTRDVRVGDRVAIPAGARALGSVMQVERGGKFSERARLGIRFHTLVLADGTKLPIATETIYRDGEAPGNSSRAKVGGAAVGGAILGAILGGGKGAAIGAAAGAGAGGAAVAAGDRSTATLPAGTAMTVRILQPVTVTIDNK